VIKNEFIELVSGLGDVEVYFCIPGNGSNISKFWDFVGLTWVTPITADCKVFATEYNSDGTVSVYRTDLTLPASSGPFLIYCYRESTGKLQGQDFTVFDAIKAQTDSLEFDAAGVHASVQSMDTDVITASALSTAAVHEIRDAVAAQITTDHGAGLYGSGTAGAISVPVQLYITDSTTPIFEVNVCVYNSDMSAILNTGRTDANGRVTFSLNAGDYVLHFHKLGVNFSSTMVDISVSDPMATTTVYGTAIDISNPSAVNTCRVFEYIFLPDSETNPSVITATARIESLPYDYDGKLHSGAIVDGVYDSATGQVYWDLVHGSTVKFTIENFFNGPVVKVIPATNTARLKTIA
jgi:hypothetical protein